VDLQKAYDYLDWGYLRLVLHKIGLQLRVVEWIMAYITNIIFFIINGCPSTFLRVG